MVIEKQEQKINGETDSENEQRFIYMLLFHTLAFHFLIERL